jgi:hypothetical protein
MSDDDFGFGFAIGIIIGLIIGGFAAAIFLTPTTSTVSGNVDYTSTSDGSTTLIIHGQTITCSLTASSVPLPITAIRAGDTVTIQYDSRTNACTVVQDLRA